MTEGTMGLSAADVAAVTKNDGYDGFGNGAWIWIILLAFLFRGNWGGNYGAESPLVSEEFIKRDIFNTNQNVSNTACQTQRDVLENRYTNQLCCCETQKEILQSRYDAALQAQTLQAQLSNCCCDLKTAIHAEGEATRGLIQANTIQDLRDRLAERDRDLSTANFQLSQQAQSANIISTLQPTPKPAYLTCSPYFAYNYGGCGNSCGC
jgi:hypothetical protein